MAETRPPRVIHQTSAAPAAIGPYSQADRARNLLFCSGQIPLDPASGEIVKEDVEARRAAASRT